ncbi:hypothetical protein HDU76_006844, partial [Blyttiomyces sp. JEL0837]
MNAPPTSVVKFPDFSDNDDDSNISDLGSLHGYSGGNNGNEPHWVTELRLLMRNEPATRFGSFI